MKLVVAIHDVTPAHASAVVRLWDTCRSRGVTPALFVVPNWHGAHALADHDDVAQWCRAAAASGAEIFLHGERHDEVGTQRTWRDSLRAAGRTNREGEFLTLDKAAAGEKIDRGLRVLRAAKLEPIGFVPPAWLSKPACRDAVRDAGLAVSEDDRAIYLHRRNVRLDAPVIRWSARTSVRAAISNALAKASRWRHARHAIVRIGLHPQDLAHAAVARSIDATLDAWLAVATPSPYAAL